MRRPWAEELALIAYNVSMVASLPIWASVSGTHPRMRGEMMARLAGRGRSAAGAIWLHGSSAGDINALLPLISALDAAGMATMVSCRTGSGERFLKRVASEGTLSTFFRAPFDVPWAVSKTLASNSTPLLLLERLELWPALWAACEARNIPIVVVNGRLSSRSARHYGLWQALFRPRFERLAAVFPATEEDARRFVTAGVRESLIMPRGNSKYAALSVEAAAFRPPAVVLGSIRVAEEAHVSSWVASLLESSPQCRIAIAPRHPHRAGKILARLARAGVAAHRSSIRGHGRVFVVDEMGTLQAHYRSATVAFIGGSFSGHGGHNVLEAAAQGVPVVTGPSIHTCADELKALVDAGAGHLCGTADEALTMLGEWLPFEEARSRAATQVAERFKQRSGDAVRAVVDLAARLCSRHCLR